MPVYDGRTLLHVVVPGNVGGRDTLVDVLDALSVHGASNSLPHPR
ncbi:hypothetical protein [Naasia sp.]|nr:hypothetical protein [Naasia sp.]